MNNANFAPFDYPEDILETLQPFQAVHPWYPTQLPLSAADRAVNLLSDEAVNEMHLNMLALGAVKPRRLPMVDGTIVDTWESRYQASGGSSQVTVGTETRAYAELQSKFPLHDRLVYKAPPGKLNVAHLYYRCINPPLTN